MLVFVYVCMYVLLYDYIYVCMHVCMYVCMYVSVLKLDDIEKCHCYYFSVCLSSFAIRDCLGVTRLVTVTQTSMIASLRFLAVDGCLYVTLFLY